MSLFARKDLIAGKNHADTYYAASAGLGVPRAAARGKITCDICIVGAGFSGISTALHLAERGYDVRVVEAVRVGYGASGRNGGQIVNGYSRDDAVIRARYGDDTANALLHMSHEGADIIRTRINRDEVACDYRPGGVFAAFTAAQMRDLEVRRRAFEAAGNTQLKMLDEKGIQASVGTDIYCGGLYDGQGGHIHPLKLVEGQARLVESRGGVVHEHSRAVHIEAGRRPVVHTESGAEIFARQVVVCGNAYLGGVLPRLTNRIMAVSSQVMTTAPLDMSTATALLPQDHCVEDCNFLLDYYRLTADRRLLFGGGVVYSGAEPADIVRRLYPRMLKTFPQLRGVKIDYAWSGHFALTLTRLPQIGRLSDTVYYIQGDSGHGVTTCHLLGRLVAEAIAGQNERFDVFANLRHYPFPGGRMLRVPLTALGAWYYAMREKLGI